MKKIGPNPKANAFYNPDPVRNPPPTNTLDNERDSELETYIRDKYQYKVFQKRAQAASAASLPPIDTARHRPPEINTRSRRNTPSPHSSTGRSLREAIDAISPSASSLMAEMDAHSRSIERNSAERQRRRGSTHTPSSAPANEVQFSSVGVLPPASSSSRSRPATASSLNTNRTLLTSSPIPIIKTTPPPPQKPSSGGFSWASTKAATVSEPAAKSPSRYPIPNKEPPPPPAHAPAPQPTAQTPTQTQPNPQPQPVKQQSLYEQDLMSLQLGSIPAASSYPVNNTNPFPTAPPSFSGATGTPFNNGALGSPFALASQPTGFNGSMAGMSLTGGTSGYTGMASPSPSLMMNGSSPANPFHSYAAMNGGPSSFSSNQSFTPQPSQPSPFSAYPSSQQPFPFQQQQQQQPQPPPFQPSFSSSPFQPSSSPSPFHSSSPASFNMTSSPFNPNPNPTNPFPFASQQHQQQPQQQQQQQNSNSPFASFSQGMLPPSHQQPQQQGYNPFMQQQQQQQPQQQQYAGMGVNSWMG